LENRVRPHINEEVRVAVIRREEVVLAHIIIPIRITGNRTNIIVNTQRLEVLISTKKGQDRTSGAREAQDNRAAKI
jgi:hypothetical protein